MAKKDKAQNQIMQYDPCTGSRNPYPSHAAQYREKYPVCAWLFNPWSGRSRMAADIGADPFGEQIDPV